MAHFQGHSVSLETGGPHDNQPPPLVLAPNPPPSLARQCSLIFSRLSSSRLLSPFHLSLLILAFPSGFSSSSTPVPSSRVPRPSSFDPPPVSPLVKQLAELGNKGVIITGLVIWHHYRRREVPTHLHHWKPTSQRKPTKTGTHGENAAPPKLILAAPPRRRRSPSNTERTAYEDRYQLYLLSKCFPRLCQESNTRRACCRTTTVLGRIEQTSCAGATSYLTAFCSTERGTLLAGRSRQFLDRVSLLPPRFCSDQAAHAVCE